MIRDQDIAPHLGRGSLFPESKRTPFYIVTPRYVRTSAGIKALHLLCHHLNSLGVPAYLVLHPPTFIQPATNLAWNTPVLTQRMRLFHYQQGLTPVVVYPETVTGNPLKAPVVMRYVLNYPGLLGGDAIYGKGEIIYGYSEKLAQSAGVADQVLFMPVSDTTIFTPPAEPGSQRAGTCFWAAKYKAVHDAPLFPVTDHSVEITRDLSDSPSQEEIARLFQHSELFYTYENTALIIEAILCGCPAVCLPNPHFTEVIGLSELGWDGIAWGDDPDEIARARATVDRARSNYLAQIDRYWYQLRAMVNQCSAQAMQTPYEACVVPMAASISLWRFGMIYGRSNGYKKLIQKAVRYVWRNSYSRIQGFLPLK